MYVKHHLSTGKVEVEYTYTHTNHSPGVKELKHLPLPTSVREDIKEKFSQGVTLERIMNGKYKYVATCYTKIIYMHIIQTSGKT